MRLLKFLERKFKIVYWYIVRIVFAKNRQKTPILTKISANLGGFMADQYFYYDFENNDRREYLSAMDWHRSKFVNEPFQFILNNKVICTKIISPYIRVPKVYAMKNRGYIIDFEGNPLTVEAILEIINENKVFIKPFAAGNGLGVKTLERENDYYLVNGVKSSRDDIIDIIKNRREWMIVEAVSQHPYANKIYDKTYNTIRIITLRDIKTNQFKLNYAFHRFGVKKSIPVDNVAIGGIVSKIDIETGVLSHARSLYVNDKISHHPDTNEPIEGVRIPHWEEIKKQVLDLANEFPFLSFVGWDILLTEDGICVIEANNSSGIALVQLWGGHRHKELGDFYRHHGVIK